jgi:hypothetical protein
VISPFASILQLKPCVFSSLVAMDRYELVLRWAEAAVDENVALKAEVTALKLQNESLEIRLAAAHDKITSLQQFCEGETAMRRAGDEVLEATRKSLDAALQSQRTLSNLRDHYQEEAETFRKELMRRGADDPRQPKPGRDTAFAALQVVCKWDRDACVQDLKKQRWLLLRRIRRMRSGSWLSMDDVARDMNYTEQFPQIMVDFDMSLHEALGGLKQQLTKISQDMPNISCHEEWSTPPLSTFMQNPFHFNESRESSSDDDMDDDDDDEFE